MSLCAQRPNAGEPITARSDRVTWTARALRRQEMPSEEISAILRADDPEIVRRYLELHRERLEERLVDHLRTVDRIERLLAQTVAGSTQLRA